MKMVFNKGFLLSLLWVVGFGVVGFAQDKEGDIVGVWLNEEKSGKIEIYQFSDKTFRGKIVWLQKQFEEDGKTPRIDKHNPNEVLAKRPLLNLIMLWGFKFEDGGWKGGHIYDPKNGSTYKCIIQLKNGELHVRGYVGLPTFGRTAVFTKSGL